MLDQFRPTTSTIGFFDEDALRVSSEYMEWQNHILARYGAVLNRRSCEGRLQEMIERLLPLTSPTRERFLFLYTDSQWCAFVDNFVNGTDAASPVHYSTKRIGCRGVRITLTSEETSPYGARILEVCQPDGGRRSIDCSQDGSTRWTFHMAGEPLPFEDTSRYRVKRVRDRFPSELALTYLDALGIRAAETSFYEPGGVASGFLLTREARQSESFEEHHVSWGSGS